MEGVYQCKGLQKSKGCGASLGLSFLICEVGVLSLPTQKVGFNALISVNHLETGTE